MDDGNGACRRRRADLALKKSMAQLQFQNIGIRALAACVPSAVSKNRDALKGIVPAAEIEKTVNAIGIIEKRIASKHTCASDLCFAAAEKLFADNPDISRESIDVLLFMSQTGDFRTPATSAILQHRLGLSKNCAAMDLSLACSGYVYALSAAFAYAGNPGVKRLLLLDGETYSKVVNPRDRVNAPLYGDAGTATLIEKSDDFGESFFVLKTDGSGEDAVKIPAGGCRVPATRETLEERADSDGNIRSDCEVFMDGMNVFNFAVRCAPDAVRDVAAVSGTSPAEADYIVFHQSNKMMTDFLAARMKIPAEKVLYSLGKYGNTSSASIPLTISECLAGRAPGGRLILCGFGAGLSWAASVLSLSKANISSVFDYEP